MKEKCIIVIKLVLMAILVSACNNEEQMFNDEEKNEKALAEIHQILEEYKDYWAPDDDYTDEQRDRMMLEVGPDSIRKLFNNLDDDFEWGFEISDEKDIESNSRADGETIYIKIYGHHKCAIADTDTEMRIRCGGTKVIVVNSDLKSNPSSQWTPEEPYPAAKVMEEGKKWMVGAAGIVRIFGIKRRFGMEGYVEKVTYTVGYAGKITHCRELKMKSKS